MPSIDGVKNLRSTLSLPEISFAVNAVSGVAGQGEQTQYSKSTGSAPPQFEGTDDSSLLLISLPAGLESPN